MPSPTDDEIPFPTLNNSANFNSAFARSHLSPDDAFASPPRRLYNGDRESSIGPRSRMSSVTGERSRSRRRKRTWQKLMWVKQSYPDNYTDQATFLGDLQLNPRLKPYDFWPLVADSTVILQHVSSVIIFVVCFVGIFQERVSPVSVASYSSFATFLGWILWEKWVTSEEQMEEQRMMTTIVSNAVGRTGSVRRRTRTGSIRRPAPFPSSALFPATPSAVNSPIGSTTHLPIGSSRPGELSGSSSMASNGGFSNGLPSGHTPRASQEHLPAVPPAIPEETLLRERLGTIKSAILIYCTLLGLSPILKSLTKSTTSDSIWAISFWLLAINIFFFDYSGGVGVKFPASLSTNAALMASTVLASRLPSTKQVFSLTLFSIEVFGLFPVFRRHVRHHSLTLHFVLAILLALGAGLGVGMVLGDSDPERWPWKNGAVGMIVGVMLAGFTTGGCSWWLISLQKYKNEIRGPWDPARPIIMSRPRWDDR